MQSSQQKILAYALSNAAFDGWGTKLLENASIDAGLDKNYHRILFPQGAADIFKFFVEEANRNMAENVKLDGLKTHEKIRACLVYRLEAIKPYKVAVKALLKNLALQPLVISKAGYSAVDAIWRLCGDTSTDFNFYSKRGLLAGVYGSSLVYFLEDKSENSQKTWEFLDKRLGEVGKFNKFMSGLKAKFKKA